MVLFRVFWRVLAACLFLGSLPVAAQEVLTVQFDRARIVEMPPGTDTIVIGNPGIADVSVLKNQNKLVLNARAFGETNMIALDAKGAALAEIVLRVTSSSHALTVQRGAERESWLCNQRCEPIVNPGDSPRHMSEALEHSTRHTGYAQPTNTGAAPGASK